MNKKSLQKKILPEALYFTKHLKPANVVCPHLKTRKPTAKRQWVYLVDLIDYLFENFFNVLSAVFVAFLGRVAVYLLRTVESSGLLYATDGNFNNCDQK